jgi:acyl-CoA synthetase (AMP-forming)/AMP-acid ligase II
MSDIYIHIGEMLARNARLYPKDIELVERNAIEKKRIVITWKQFDEKANKFANILSNKGVKKGDKVGHWMQNSIDWLVVYLGISTNQRTHIDRRKS